jgi:hypothetical protein
MPSAFTLKVLGLSYNNVMPSALIFHTHFLFFKISINEIIMPTALIFKDL